MMLYLIIPPIVIIISIFLVIWLFYRRRNEAVSDESVKKDNLKKRRFNVNKFKSIFSFLVSIIKNIFSKIHDFVGQVSLLQQRKKTVDDVIPHTEEIIKDIESKHIKNEEFKEMILEPVRPESYPNETGDKEISKNFNKVKKNKKESVIENKKSIDLNIRPTISETVIHPEKTSDSRAKLEEILIERIASNPRDLEAYERLGEYYIDQKNYKDARECFSQVLKLSPKHVKAKMNLQKIGMLRDEEEKISL